MAPRKGIVAFSFGHPKTLRSNVRIAKIASEQALFGVAGIFAQKDVPVQPDIRFADGLVFAQQEWNYPPPSTLEVAIQAAKWIERHKFDEVEALAAGPHIWRAHRDLKEAVGRLGLTVPVTMATVVDDDEWFCAGSRQWFTRSRNLWDLREKPLRKLPFPVYQAIVT